MSTKFTKIIEFIKSLYKKELVPVHEPRFIGHEKEYLIKCIDSSYVSYIGEFVNLFEQKVKEYAGCNYAIATVNGTCALHIALKLVGVEKNTEVLMPALTFVATANAIAHLDAHPVFIDSDKETLGLDVGKLEIFLNNETLIRDNCCYNKRTNRKISACLPVHIFGHPAKIDEIKKICDQHNIVVVEDAAESLGSFYNGKHTGTFGKIGIFSFNGNKIVTTGGGGMIVTDDKNLASKVRHITTTAKVSHKWEYIHDHVGYNYRMPNVNAAVGLAQFECLEMFLKDKRELANLYDKFFREIGVEFFVEKANVRSNYWLNTIYLSGLDERDAFLEYANQNGVMARPVWKLMNYLKMYEKNQTTDLSNAKYISERAVSIPSGVRL